MNLFIKRAVAILLVALMVGTIIPVTVMAETKPASICSDGHNYGRKINSVAHRGYSKDAPENTLPAYRMAKEKGFFYVECDVAYTKDSVPVLLHLDDIKHTSNGSGSVSQFTYSQLLNYDFGSWKGAEFAGTKIPTFEEFVALCAQIGLHPYIELKESGNFTQQKIQELVDILKKYNMLEQCTWITFIHDYLFYVRNCDPNARMGLLWPYDVNASLINKANSIRTAANEVFLNTNYDNLTANGIQLAESNNYALEVYTINTESAIKSMPEYISGVTSDWIVAQQVIGGNNSVVTPPTCTERGYTTYTCIDCGETYVGDYVAALGHEYGDGDQCLRCEYEGDKYTYFVYDALNGGSDANNGFSPIAPFLTFDKAIKTAKTLGVSQGDTITINLKGNVTWGGNINSNGISTNWEVLTNHDFKIVVTSGDGTAILGDGNKNIIFGGDIDFKNIKINAGSNWKSLCFVGNSVSFNNTSFISDEFDLILGTRSQHTVNKETKVNLNVYRPKIFVGNSYQRITYNNNFILNIGANPNKNDILLVMASSDSNKTIFNAGAEIITNASNTLKFQNGNMVEIGQNGYLNIINTAADKTVNVSSVGLSSVALSKTWVLNISSAEVVTSTKQAGVFSVPVGYIATAVSNKGTIKSSAGRLIIAAGQYSVNVQTCTNHVYDNTTDTDCNICLDVREIDDTPCTHNYEWKTDKSNNCGENGTKHEECTICGDKRNQNTVIPATGNHSYDNDCDTECNICKTSRSVTHNYEWKTDKVNNCGENGTKHEECTICGDKRNQNTIIPATGKHSYDNDCDTECNVCKTLRSVAHSYEWKTDKSNNCGENGTKHEECTICGDKRNQNTVIPATGKHSYDDDCDTECNICKTLRSVTHNYEWKTDKSNNCGESGLKHEECTICGDKRNQNTVISATGNHIYTNEADASCDICDTNREVVGEFLIKENGKWLCYIDGERFTGTKFIKFSGKYFYVENGVWKASTTLVKYNGKWFYLEGGKWDKTVTTLFKYSGKWFYIINGKWNSSFNDVIEFKEKDFYIKNGKWDSSDTTLFKKNGNWLAIKNGKWYKGETLINYSGKKFYVNKGYAQLSFSGKVVIKSKTYKIKNGKVV